MLMRKEDPANSLSPVLGDNHLHALHLNDGYGRSYDGIMIGTCSLMATVECVHYLKKYGYDGLVYFKIDKYGVDRIY